MDKNLKIISIIIVTILLLGIFFAFFTDMRTEDPEIEEYILTINVEGEGEITPSEGTHTYQENEEVTITAEAAEEYEFSHFTGDCTDTTCTLTMDQDREITAHFTEKDYGENGLAPTSCEELECEENEICIEVHDGVFSCVEKDECTESGCAGVLDCVKEDERHFCEETPINIEYNHNINSNCDDACMVTAFVTYSHEEGTEPTRNQICYKENDGYNCIDLSTQEEDYEEGTIFVGEAGDPFDEERGLEKGEELSFYFIFSDGEKTVRSQTYSHLLQ